MVAFNGLNYWLNDWWLNYSNGNSLKLCLCPWCWKCQNTTKLSVALLGAETFKIKVSFCFCPYSSKCQTQHAFVSVSMMLKVSNWTYIAFVFPDIVLKLEANLSLCFWTSIPTLLLCLFFITFKLTERNTSAYVNVNGLRVLLCRTCKWLQKCWRNNPVRKCLEKKHNTCKITFQCITK